MIAALAAILTILVGPLMFYIISHKIYRKQKLRKYPTGLADAMGDAIFLPLFNALAAYYGIFDIVFSNQPVFLLTFLLTLIFSSIFLIYRKNYSSENDWSRPKKQRFNAGGWYHQFFVIAESFLIFISLLHFYDISVLWFFLLGYLLTATYYWLHQVPRRALR